MRPSNISEYGNLSYSQEGEDKILDRLFLNRNEGFYVDVGAHHPFRFSNTYFFYKKGWTGINIDAMPGSMTEFKKYRTRDINLEVGISKSEVSLDYYIFNEPALNTFSKTEAEKKDGLRSYKIIDTQTIDTFPLKQIFHQYLRDEKKIDFMTIDVEGLDLEVLQSNDWNKYRPEIVLVESLHKYAISDLINKSDVYITMINNGYEFVAKTLNTLFFKDNLS